MKSMDVSTEDSDCMVEATTPAKRKKMKQAQLPFQTLNSSKSPNNADNVFNKKKRKVMSPLAESKSPKMVKLATKENSVRRVPDKEGGDASERKLDVSSDIIEITSNDEEKDEKQSDHQKTKKGDSTPKRRSLGKNKKLDGAQQKPGALTKFLKKAEREVEENHDSNHDNLSELKDRKDCQDIPVHKEKNETCLNVLKKTDTDEVIVVEESDSYDDNLSELKDRSQDTSIYEEENETCLNESSDIQFTHSELQDTSQLSEIDNRANKDADLSSQESDCDITNLSSDNESELDKSISSKNNETSSKCASPVTPKTDKDKKIKKLSLKQLEKRQEIARKKEEKQRLKMEKEKKQQEEKANRQRKREEKQREKEEKERIEKEQKKKEKELKELKKQMEMEQKQKEKEAKEEERKKREEAKEEEKRRKEEERLEAERKKQKAASNFASFFVSKKQEVKSAEEESVVEVKNFMPFEIKTDMRIAPICRRKLTEHDKLLLDNKCNVDLDKTELYLEDIKRGRIVPHTSSKTWPLEAKDDDIVLLDEDNDGSSNIIMGTQTIDKHRPKLLQFSENRRPPYWGTWRKLSNVLNFRRPFAKDKKWFDYEIDSDDEWEEEEPGESLKGSDDEKDEENPEENEYDVDNEFMVPHGYLSDEEAQADEEEMEDMSPQTQKLKLKILGERFEAERNAKTHKLKPKIIGCIWQGPGNSFPESVPSKVKEFLSARQAWVNNIPIILPSSSPEEDISANAECKTPTHQSVRGSKKTKFPDEALPDLIRLVHGNRHGRHVLIREFMTFWSKKGGSHLSKVSVLSKINEIANRIACPEEGPMHLKSCWYVSEDIRKQYFPDVELSLPNHWKYILTPSRKSDLQNITGDKTEKEEKDKEKEKKHVPLITQFTKKITQEEMKKQLAKSDQEETKKQSTSDQKETEKQARSSQEETKKQSVANQEEIKKQSASKSPPDQISILPPLQRPPKRATLISVGRGEQFPEGSRQNMLAKFGAFNKKKEEPLSTEKTVDSDKNRFVESDMNKTNQKLESSDNRKTSARKTS